jgi:hypothetical protein
VQARLPRRVRLRGHEPVLLVQGQRQKVILRSKDFVRILLIFLKKETHRSIHFLEF